MTLEWLERKVTPWIPVIVAIVLLVIGYQAGHLQGKWDEQVGWEQTHPLTIAVACKWPDDNQQPEVLVSRKTGQPCAIMQELMQNGKFNPEGKNFEVDIATGGKAWFTFWYEAETWMGQQEYREDKLR